MASVLGFRVVGYGDPALAAFKIPGTSIALTANRDVAPLLVYFAARFHAEVEPLHKGWCWGHSPKPIEGSQVWSNHAWGGAWDLNAPAHPMGKRNTFSATKRRKIDDILRALTFEGVRVLRHGKDYVRRPDDMHVEVNVPRALAVRAARALQTRPSGLVVPKPAAKPASKPSKATPNRPGSRTLRVTKPMMHGPDVEFVQEFIGRKRCGKADGWFGNDTRAGVRWYQDMRGLPVTGVVDAATWRHMGVKG